MIRNRPLLKGFVQFFLLVISLIVLGAITGHCSTSAPRHDNGLGVVIPFSNPYTYLFGNIINQPGNPNRVIRDSKGRVATNLVFQPAHVFELYAEPVLFCGNQALAFRDMVGPIVITYKTAAHQMVDGVACHELQSVYKVQAEEIQ